MHFNGRDIDIKIWNGESLGKNLAIDTETDLTPFTETPEIITCQVYDYQAVYYVRIEDLNKFFAQHDTNMYIFANAAFDIDVLEKASNWDYFNHIDKGKVQDIQILYRLYRLARDGVVPFRYNLQLLTETYLKEKLAKDDDIRCNFGQFKGKPIEEIPLEFLEYGAKDVIATWELHQKFLSWINNRGAKNLLSHDIQLKGALALNRIYKNGIGFNPEKAKKFLEEVYTEMGKCEDILATYGWVRGTKGIKDKFDVIAKLYNLPIPKTEDGHYTTKEKELVPYKKNNFIKHFLNFITLEKTTTFIRNLSGNRVHPRYNLLKNTGRTSCSRPNFQQLPREGQIRSMFIANEEHTFVITDYSTIELCALAQVLYDRFGENEMMKRINAGEDLHAYYASVLYKIPIEEVTKKQRQSAKAANFGFPGGLGVETFVEFAQGYGIGLDIKKAKEMKRKWFQAFPKMRYYLEGEMGKVFTLTGRERGNTTYCAEKNTPFQGLAADGAKIALYELDKAGFKTVGFVHDEIITEIPSKDMINMLGLQEEIMVKAMQTVIPDVKVTVESTISKEYCK